MPYALAVLRRQGLLIALMVVPWLLGVWQLGRVAHQQHIVPLFGLLAFVPALAMSVAVFSLIRDLQRYRQWRQRDDDVMVWACVAVIYAASAGLAHWLILTSTVCYLTGFLGLAVPVLVRFNQRVALAVIVVNSLLVGFLQGTLPLASFALYVFGYQVVLWRLAFSSLHEWQLMQQVTMTQSQLRASQELLIHSIGSNERLQSQRNLHEKLGHHAVALNLQLQLLQHKVSGDASQPVAQAQFLVSQLLTDIRQVSQQGEDEHTLGLHRLLEGLLQRLPFVSYHLYFALDLPLHDDRKAECLLRVLQESLLHVLAYSQAPHVVIYFVLEEEIDSYRLIIEHHGELPLPTLEQEAWQALLTRLSALEGRLLMQAINTGGYRLEVQVPRSWIR